MADSSKLNAVLNVQECDATGDDSSYEVGNIIIHYLNSKLYQMKIAFHGAARTVTGSKHLITLKNGKKILLDCGMFQGMGKETDSLNRTFGFNPEEVTAMILSHAHIDHSGLIPRLTKEGFTGTIFCTDATKQLCVLLLEDSAEIQENEVKYHNKGSRAQGTPLLQPLYTVEDAKNCMRNFQTQPYGEWFGVTDGV